MYATFEVLDRKTGKAFVEIIPDPVWALLKGLRLDESYCGGLRNPFAPPKKPWKKLFVVGIYTENRLLTNGFRPCTVPWNRREPLTSKSSIQATPLREAEVSEARPMSAKNQ